MHVSTAANRPLALTARVVVALGGGYAFTWALVALGIAGLTAAGIDFHEAEMALLMLAFVAYPGVFIWAFVAPGLVRVTTWLGGGALCMAAAAWTLQRIVLG